MANMKITLKKAGRLENTATAHSLGLKKINDVTVQPADNAQTRGKLG